MLKLLILPYHVLRINTRRLGLYHVEIELINPFNYVYTEGESYVGIGMRFGVNGE